MTNTIQGPLNSSLVPGPTNERISVTGFLANLPSPEGRKSSVSTLTTQPDSDSHVPPPVTTHTAPVPFRSAPPATVRTATSPFRPPPSVRSIKITTNANLRNYLSAPN